ncbi:hypothetical protein EJV47_13290 [Hymenobacter gummosus]|uniref:Uncharacterized protein n=1 Tax=Hymenobacter gummosus TaxID=1776032 RepID=A0A3S0H592_9BACT|nr:hypothetical protein [Hymenobacter gummosus]RTQ49777.1 hypothetical protein EJV47_13290 [Hymenobacter gummosus]
MHLLLAALLLFPPESYPVVDDASRVLTQRRLSSFQQFHANLSRQHPQAQTTEGSGRDVVRGFREYVFGFRVTVPTADHPESGVLYPYRVTLITEGDKIIYYVLAAQRNKRVADGWQPYHEPVKQYQDEAAFARLTSAYRGTFGVAPDLAALFDRTATYGAGCSLSGSGPRERRTVRELVARRDTATLLRDWLRSATAEKQVYGVEGFYQLRQQGLRLTPGQLRLILFIKRKRGRINTCSGCSYGSDEMSTATRAFAFPPQPGR